jgi:hypothetical protein
MFREFLHTQTAGAMPPALRYLDLINTLICVGGDDPAAFGAGWIQLVS